MNQKNSLGLDICFKDLDNPIDLFKEWFDESKKYEQKDPNALALATSDETGTPSVRMVLLKGYDEKGFKIVSKEVMEKEVTITTEENTKLYEDEESKMIINIVVSMSNFLSIKLKFLEGRAAYINLEP